MKSVDISEYNGVVNFPRIKQAGIGAVLIRAGYGKKTRDRYISDNLTGAALAGLPAGIYWFSYAYNEEMARNEANQCLEVVKGYDLKLPIYWDWEAASANYMNKCGVKPTKKLVTNMCLAFCEQITKAGYRAGYYCNYSDYTTYFDKSKLKAYSFWFAYWSNHIKTGISCDIWQYSASGKVAGITGSVDCDLVMNESIIKSNKKSTGVIALEVIKGDWGDGTARKKALTAAGYNYAAVQEIVNKIMEVVNSAY